jgi:hypothetical protein
MCAVRFPCGKQVKLLVDYQGYPDGRLVLFEIWRRKGSKEEKVSEVYGVTRGGKGIGQWIPQIEREEALPLEEKISQQVEGKKYYFVAKVDDQETKSGDLEFTYPLDLFLKDEDGKPIDGFECTITFSDGSKKKGVIKNGHAKFEEAPQGKFSLELKGHEFVFKA